MGRSFYYSNEPTAVGGLCYKSGDVRMSLLRSGKLPVERSPEKKRRVNSSSVLRFSTLVLKRAICSPVANSRETMRLHVDMTSARDLVIDAMFQHVRASFSPAPSPLSFNLSSNQILLFFFSGTSKPQIGSADASI